jgi:hypothetical protein
MIESALGVAENAGVVGLVKDKVSIDQAVVNIACLNTCHILETRSTFSNVSLGVDVDLFRKQVLTASNMLGHVCFAYLNEVPRA